MSLHKSVHPTSSVNDTPCDAGGALTSSFPFENGKSLVPYLTQHHFEIQILPSFSQIVGGLIPGFKALVQPTNLLQVVFVEVPDQRLEGHLEFNRVYITETDVDGEIYNILHQAVPGSISRITKSKRNQVTECVPVIMASYVCAYTLKNDLYSHDQSQLLLAIEMIDSDKIWDIIIVDWEWYHNTLVTMGGRDECCKYLWNRLVRHTKLIVGGLNFANDFM